MTQWIDAIKSCYEVENNDGEVENKLFDLLNGEAKGRATRVLSNDDMAAFSWETSDSKFIMAAGVAEPQEKELPEKVEEILKKLIGDRENGLFVARNVVIDDMFGVEVCGATMFDDVETVFYGAYLTDGVEGFTLVGLADGEPEQAFDELSGAARTFFRKPYPATIEQGKNFNEMFNATRELAKITVPMTTSDYAIANTTFSIEDGVVNVKPTVLIITKDDVIPLDTDELDIDFTNPLKEFTSIMSDFSDMSGFTVTNFKDGRYGITYYPEDPMDNEDEHGHSHEHEIDYVNELGKAPRDLEPDLIKLGSDIITSLDKSWKHCMAVINYDGEFYTLSVFSSDGKSSYKLSEVPDSLDEKINDQLDLLGDILDEDYSGWNTLAFAFEKKNDSDDIEEHSVRYEIFDFEIFIDSSDYDDESDNAYFAETCELFADELNSSNTPVSSISVKIVGDELGKFIIEDASLSTPTGIELAKTFDKYKTQILRITDEVLGNNIEFDTVNYTIFPNGIVGCSLDMNSGEVLVTKENFDETIDDSGLEEYKDELKEIAHNNISALIYEVDTEESVSVGRSRLGGAPDMPEGSEWAKDKNGKTLPFIAQINLSEVAIATGDTKLPKSGMLTFFYKESTNECKVIFSEAKELEQIYFPNDLEIMEEYIGSVLRFIPTVSLPCNSDIDFKSEEECNSYDASFVRLGGCKLLGYPDLIDCDDDIIEGDDVLLFQVSSNRQSEMVFADEGTIYFIISGSDLKSRNFKNVRCKLQTY